MTPDELDDLVDGVQPLGGGDLGALLDDVEGFVRRFVVFGSEHQSAAAALWVAHVYAIASAHATPYLRIKSAVEESGKSTLVDVLASVLGPRCISAVSVSPSVVFRMRDRRGPFALLLDEVDQTLRDRKDDNGRDLLAIINDGYRRGKTVLRSVGCAHEPRAFSVFGPCVIAGLATLHPTTESRCIPIELDQAFAVERFLPFLPEIEAPLVALRERLDAWATEEVIERLRIARPSFPDGLRSRSVEVWWNLWAIADEAGGEWPARARDAALVLHAGADPDAVSKGRLLLAHIREAFGDGEDRIASARLVRRLVENDAGPWGRFWGAELDRVDRAAGTMEEGSPRAAMSELAKHLRPFKRADGSRIEPRTHKIDGRPQRGYLREDFQDAWERYVAGPVTHTPVTGVTHVTPLASTVTSVTSVTGGDEEPTEDEPLTLFPADEAERLALVIETFGVTPSTEG
jgi:hypothetical protein